MCNSFCTVEDLTDEGQLLGVAGGGEGLQRQHEGLLQHLRVLAHEEDVVAGQIKVATHPDNGELKTP